MPGSSHTGPASTRPVPGPADAARLRSMVERLEQRAILRRGEETVLAAARATLARLEPDGQAGH